MTILIVLLASCAHVQFEETAGKALQSVLQATSATRDLAVESARLSQERVVDDLEVAVKALPDNPGRGAAVEALKVDARAKVAVIRETRDRVLDACGKSYRVIGMAQALVPMMDVPAYRAEVLALLKQAYDTLKAVQ